MIQTEQNIKDSFKLVKADIIKIQSELIEITLRERKILEILSKMNKKTADKKTVKIKASKKITKKTETVFVASKTGKKFHLKNCPFAKNIKPKSKLTFKSKNAALNKGLKPCNCVK